MQHGRFSPASGLAAALLAVSLVVPALVTLAEPAVHAPVSAEPPAVTGLTSVATNHLWFPVGETLVYRVYWGFLSVGEAVITSEWVEDEGKRYIKITHKVRSNKVIATLYPVEDTVETLIDPVTFGSVSFFLDQREGRHRAKEITTFDYEKGVARWESFTKKKVKLIPIDRDTRDLVTMMYYVRKDGFRKGEDRKLRVLADDKVYDLAVKADGVEEIDVPGRGEVECLRLDPSAKFNGLFVRKGKMTIWVSTDKRSLCTRVEAGVPVIGSVKILLVSVGGPGSDAWVKKAEGK